MLANFDSPHAWRWVKVFAERGHDVHAISYYPPARPLPDVALHVLRPRASRTPGAAPEATRASRFPPTLARLANAVRFRRAGLPALVRSLRPDVFHAHYVVEHGFFAALCGFHPFVVSAWGSDLFQAPRSAAGAAIARYVLRAADLVTGNDPTLVREALRLGARPDGTALVRLGLDAEWLGEPLKGVNLGGPDAPPTVISDRALEPLYNIDVVVRAFAILRQSLPAARLVLAGDGSQRPAIAALVHDLDLDQATTMTGRVDQQQLRLLLEEAHVYVSVPSSDSLALSTMEAMAAGAFPVVSDLDSQDGWVEDRSTGLRVPVRDASALARTLETALADAGLRRRAAAANHEKVTREGSLEKNMLAMERHYYRLAGHPLAEEGL